MNLALWIAAGVVAAASLGASFNKLLVPREKLLANPRMAWAQDFTQGQIRLIAVPELAGAIGLILPQETDVLPVLTPLAACGIVALQLGAMRTHAKRREVQMIAINLVLITLAA